MSLNTCPTNDTLLIVQAATRALERIFRAGFAYHKAGVLLSDLVPDSPTQLCLFPLDHKDDADETRRQLMETLDCINGTFGQDTIRLAATGTTQPWRMKQAHRSPRYTTRWQELASVS